MKKNCSFFVKVVDFYILICYYYYEKWGEFVENLKYSDVLSLTKKLYNCLIVETSLIKCMKDEIIEEAANDAYRMVVKCYDPSKSSLPTFLHLVVTRYLMLKLRKVKNALSLLSVPLDTIIADDGIPITLGGSIEDTSITPFDDDLFYKEACDKLFKKFTKPLDKHILNGLYEGYTQTQIAHRYKVSKQRVSDKIHEYRKFLIDTYKVRFF